MSQIPTKLCRIFGRKKNPQIKRISWELLILIKSYSWAVTSDVMEVEDLDATMRGVGEFGSTGV